MSYAQAVNRYMTAAIAAGWDYETANAVRRDAQRIHTIAEHECNGTLERCEEEGRVDHRGKPMIVDKVYQVCGQDRPGPIRYYRTADRETPARERIEAAAKSIGATVEFQGDPRGWPVTIKTSDGRELSPPIR